MRTHGRKLSAGVAVLVFALIATLWAMKQQNPGKEDAAYWNDMAEAYLEQDRMPEVFEAHEKAIAADPKDWVAFYSLGDALLLSRKEAAQHYRLEVEKIFDRVFELYDHAVTLAPDSYPLAADVAQSHYLVQPRRPARALQAWRHALALAPTEWDRAECYVNLARTQINAGLYAAASDSLVQITDPAHAETKARLLRRLRVEGHGRVGDNRSEVHIEVRSEPPAAADPVAPTPERATF